MFLNSSTYQRIYLQNILRSKKILDSFGVFGGFSNKTN